MIQVTALAKSIEKELNENLNSTAFDTKFKIFASVGNYEKATQKTTGGKQKYINGVLKSSTGNYVPMKELNNLLTSLTLEFAVPQDKMEQVELILSSWTESVIGEVFSFGENWNFIMTPQPATPGTAQNTTPLGSMIPLMIVLEIQFIKNGLISNMVEWTLNNEIIRPEHVSEVWDRTPYTRATPTGICKSENQYETNTLIFVLPYSYSMAIKTLMGDLKGHLKDKVYHIKRDDGFSEIMEDDYILTNIEYNEESGKIVSFTLTFTLADI